MAVNLTNADNALKSYYLEAVSEQLDNGVNPFLAQIKKTSENVWGKEVKKLAIHGLNGGIGAGTEDGNLPAAQGNHYVQFSSTLKNLYGTVEISDKAIRASENNSGAFVSLLNAEMDGLLKASSFNFGRMLFGDGTGKIAQVSDIGEGAIELNTVTGLIEGMIIDFRTSAGALIPAASGREILIADRITNCIYVSGTDLTLTDVPRGSFITVHDSYNNEITGLGAIFDSDVATLYGVDKMTNYWITPYVESDVGTISETAIQTVLDAVEEAGGDTPDMILTSFGVRRSLIKVLGDKRVLGNMEIAGGFKALSYNGIPVVADRFCPKNTMYVLNTKDFALHQLCDWQWLTDDDGKILRQIPGKPVYTATLVKYAELMCSRPYAQGMLKGVTEI